MPPGDQDSFETVRISCFLLLCHGIIFCLSGSMIILRSSIIHLTLGKPYTLFPVLYLSSSTSRPKSKFKLPGFSRNSLGGEPASEFWFASCKGSPFLLWVWLLLFPYILGILAMHLFLLNLLGWLVHKTMFQVYNSIENNTFHMLYRMFNCLIWRSSREFI